MTKVKLSLKIQKKTKKQLMSRVRKEGRYSALTTITMWLLKDVNKDLYENEKILAVLESINTQKNYYSIVLRMSMAYTYLLQNNEMTAESVANQIFRYIQSRLKAVIKHKYGNTNPRLFLQMVYEKNFNDLTILKNVFASQFKDLQSVQKLLLGLYQKTSIRQHGAELKKIAQIIIKYCSTQKKNKMQSINKLNEQADSTKEEKIIPKLFYQESTVGTVKRKNDSQIQFQGLINQYLPKISQKNQQMILIQQNCQNTQKDLNWDELFSDLFFF